MKNKTYTLALWHAIRLARVAGYEGARLPQIRRVVRTGLIRRKSILMMRIGMHKTPCTV
jgi:hypothetical protein